MGTHLDTPPANGLRRRIVLVVAALLLLLFHALGRLASGTTSVTRRDICYQPVAFTIAHTYAVGVGRATSTGLTDKPNHVTSDAPPASPGLHGFADFAGYPLSSLEDAVLGVVHDVLQPVVNWRY